MKSYGPVLGALGFALSSGATAWAQGAAKPETTSGSGLFSLLLICSPVLLVILFLFPMMRRAKRGAMQIDRSLEIAEETLLLARQTVDLQAETNRLLGQLIETLGRDRGYWSSHE